ncbi:MAG: hypothetical protein HYR56_26100 [Acidobacteria bacterium]|nr:hypothetical protein [Acidobacteriota bacterium]MBI3427270.1 hypothetical protein [Acidobacteriota bacterium]
MKTRIASLSACFVLALLTVAWAADVNGKWTAEVPGRQGAMQTMTMTFKAEGSKLTGTVSGQQGDTAISDGKVEGNDISFTVVREFNGNSIKQVFKGKLAGDEIKFTRSTEGAPGGQARPPVEFTAKRAK